VTERAERQASSLEELYERHAAGAVRLAYLITSDRELSRDLAQDAFVRVAGRFRHLRVPDAFDVYLRRTVVNLCMSHFRHRRVERGYLEREGGAPQRVAQPPELGTRDELRLALGRLPIRQRTAIVLHYYGDLSEGEVAAAMRCSACRAQLVSGDGDASNDRREAGAMTDLEGRIRELLEDDGRSAPPPHDPKRAVGRTRRRQVLALATTVLGVVAVAALSVVGLRTALTSDRGAPAAETTETTTINGISITHPDGWFVSDPDELGLNGPTDAPPNARVGLPRLILAVSPTDPGEMFGCPGLVAGTKPASLMTIQESPVALAGGAAATWPAGAPTHRVGRQRRRRVGGGRLLSGMGVPARGLDRTGTHLRGAGRFRIQRERRGTRRDDRCSRA
jgi:RNA polymerase sigma factor (sigma-70 family)